MTSDTRTVVDVITLDPVFLKELEDIIQEEKEFWERTGHKSTNDFIESITPVVKSEIKMRIIKSLERLKLPFLGKYIDYDRVDIPHLIPVIVKL